MSIQETIKKTRKYRPRKKKPDVKENLITSKEKIEFAKKEIISKQADPPPFEIKPKPGNEKLLTLEEIQRNNKEVESAEQAKIKGKDKEFPDGVFDEMQTDDTLGDTPKSDTEIEEQKRKAEQLKSDVKNRPFNLTICIDTFISIICMFIFSDLKDPTVLDLTPGEIKYFTELELKCGIDFSINSPWFYAGALFMCYGAKIKTLWQLNKLEKQLKIEAEQEKQLNGEKQPPQTKSNGKEK